MDGLCRVVKLKFPDAQDIVGIATEPGLSNPFRSEDAMYFDARAWTAENEEDARELQSKAELLLNVTESRIHEKEYPVGLPPPGMYTVIRARRKATSLRNSLCPCGSGKKYKRCCGAAGRF